MTTAGLIRTVPAVVSIVVGFVQLIRPKGGRSHRRLGYAYVVAMLLANISALAIRQFTGGFNIFHAGAIVNLAAIAAAMWPMLRRPRPANWLLTHYRWMAGSYIGLIAAGLTEVVVRVGPFATKAQLWAVAATVAAIVSVVGCVLIARYRPQLASYKGDMTA